MKPIKLLLLVLIFTFALGVATTFFWLEHRIQHEKSDVVSSAIQNTPTLNELPILEYCELTRNHDKYNGKVVKIRTKLHFSYHGFVIVDERCQYESEQIAINYDDELLKQFFDEQHQPSEYGIWSTPEITVIGQFNRIEPIDEDEVMATVTTTGQKYLQFKLLEVEDALKK